MKILVADDEKNIRNSIASLLSSEGIESSTAGDGIVAKSLLESEAFDGMITDLRMPRMDGLELLAWLAEAGPRLPVIVISAYGDIGDAVQAMKLGARDYLVKPFDPEELLLRVRRLLEEGIAVKRAEAGAKALNGKDSGTIAWIGESSKMRDVRSLVEKVAPTPSTVLVTGESGTGKEVVAKLIHSLSATPDGPFVAINIGGMPDALIESELFGFDKGAFTGATERKRGMFELANSGTLFLDEIGDMPMHLQVKLLRVLQDRKIQHLGSTQPIPINSRIVAATNRKLERLLAEGKFREDLYYRLNVVRIEMPPLRERAEDIPLLAGYFVEKLNGERGQKVKGITPDALSKLQSYAFPGNVRELENVIERAYIFCAGREIDAKALGEPFLGTAHPSQEGVLRNLEMDAINKAIAKHGGNMSKAAAELGINRKTLYNKRKEIGLF